MTLGENLLKLRKKANLSQEEVAEKLDVTRQTISNWELDQTSPDLEQAKKLSNLYSISLDDLVNNDVKNILIEKVSNTEKLAGLVIKILKIIGLLFLIFIVVFIILIVIFYLFKKQPDNSLIKEATINCQIADNKYDITIGSDTFYSCPTCTKEMNVYLKDITDWANLDQSIININKYFTDNGGSCEESN